ncbi:alpha-L-fucosidase [Actinophytocola gossypii]|uniref:alpha-L-fucosidase n=1 Tax=Actinophytocola gossypii TaxID=2812003 RepID=A0ABT2JCF4_9PSEU|nr:alpha-L-fucosidase [Actinophytocola gossypii]MCT2585530.1 alpha-L-fucosidase [Actinophytocola gossypii]
MFGNRITRRTLLAGSAAAAGIGTLSPTIATAATAPRRWYEPTWESLDTHPLPSWFDDAKLGIFIHWGVFSVPAWAPRGEYAEWYPSAMRNPNNPTHAYHRRTYGADFAYRDFIPMFRAERWDPAEWVDLFAAAGARYVVPVGTHHDGFPLWRTRTTDWNSTTMGPRRDILRELGDAARARRMHYAPSYHQLLNYYAPEFDAPHPDYLSEKYLREWMHPQMRELVEDIGSEMLWLDGDWNDPAESFGTKEFVAWYYNRAAAHREQVLVNDRLGMVRSEHGDFYTQEYDYDTGQGPQHKWENTRGCGLSFGYNRNEPLEDYLTIDQLVTMFVDNVAHWGNLLLNVGPRADGTIDDVQVDLLRGLGRWLEVNGEGIYGSRVWTVQRGTTAEGLETRYTTRDGGDRVYAFLLGRPGRTVTIPAADLPPLRRGDQVRLLGRPRPLRWTRRGDQVLVDLPDAPPDQPVHTLRFRRERR